MLGSKRVSAYRRMGPRERVDGYGPHTNNPHIFYVDKVHDVIVL
jgi:hypothetical protein